MRDEEPSRQPVAAANVFGCVGVIVLCYVLRIVSNRRVIAVMIVWIGIDARWVF